MDITSYLLGKKAGGGETPTYQDKEITITENGEQTITADDGYNALSSVGLTVNVPSGADLSEYFDNTITKGSSYVNPGWAKLIKKLPPTVLTITGTDMSYAFSGCTVAIPPLVNAENVTNWFYAFNGTTYTGKLDLSYIQFNSDINRISNIFYTAKYSEINLSTLGTLDSVNDFDNMFQWCNKTKKIDLRNLKTNQNNISAMGMFAYCEELEELDMSSFDFTKIGSEFNMFTNVPANCLIYVKDQTQVDWFTTNFPSMTNIQIK